ncbi:hypothetical protein CVT24_013122 [Panaeolus cyanescens]|uniref:Uncharacterized protein n=1 Tax=Panaeolus cyanescens TaxID=181874 RepID=A0A409YN70_9AGAR|nr:hypothetical protein CVT24_013122 [Panaeolus cyanescens]
MKFEQMNERLVHTPELYLLALAQFAITANTQVMRSFSLVLLHCLLFRTSPDCITPHTLRPTIPPNAHNPGTPPSLYQISILHLHPQPHPLPCLKVIELGECPIHDTLAPLDLNISTFIQKHTSSSSLQQLQISPPSLYQISILHLHPQPHPLPCLKVIELGECPIHDTLAPLDLNISTFIQKHTSSSSLQQLQISSTLTPRALEAIETFKNLQNLQLNLSTTGAISYSFLVSLSNLEHLQELNIDGASFSFTPEQSRSDLSFASLT